MRILQVGKYLPPVPGGIETVVYELSTGLSKLAGVEVTCLVSNTGPRTIRERVNNFDVVRAGSFGSLASTPLSPTFRTEARKIATDMTHFHLPNPLATAALFDTKSPYVVTYHCDIIRYPQLFKLYEPSMRRFLGGAKKIVVSSKALIKSSPVLKDFQDKCAVIPFAIDSANLELNESRAKLRDKILRAHGDRIILFVGRLVGYKGLPDLIRAMKNVDGKLIVVGTGPELENLKALSKRENVAHKIEFAGYVAQNDLGAYYNAAKALALTSINESEAFGVCLVEALSCGTPLVTTRVPTGVSGVNIDGVTGFQVKIGDAQAIADKLNLLLDDEPTQRAMAAGALEHFNRNFSAKRMADDHFKIYREILG